MNYVTRDDLMDLLLTALEEGLAEKTTSKERIGIADAIVEALDGPVLTVVDEEEETDEDETSGYEVD